MASYTFRHYTGPRVVVDLASQVLRAELDDRPGWRGGSGSIHASVAESGVTGDFIPLFALTTKAKRFDDRLYACVDRLAHEGAGEREGIFAVLERIRTRLPEGTNVRALFEAARHLAEDTRPEDGPQKIRVRKWLAGFLTDPKKSKPIGFYAGSEDLERIFRHDRLLQTELAADDAKLVRDVLTSDAALHTAYRRHLTLLTKLTGEFAIPPVDDAETRVSAVLPASDSAEGRLIKDLFGAESVPDGFELGAELVTRIRDCRLRTEPHAGDGWYAHQLHAIAALLAAETDGLQLGPRYRKELEEAFRALFTLNRETHVKQLEIPAAGGGRPLIVAPRITVEPLPNVYARTASAYRFLRESLSEELGEDVLRSAEIDGVSAYDAILDMELLFLGAEAVSRAELGRPLASSFDRDAARTRFRTWQRHVDTDPDLTYDLRVAVPLWFDRERKTVRVSAMLGVETRALTCEFVERPNVRVFGGPEEPEFHSSSNDILAPVTIECDVREPPSREELRAICDRYEDASEIRRALEAR